jgi:hypothetical protein
MTSVEFVRGPVLVIEVPSVDDVARKVEEAGGSAHRTSGTGCA